MPVQLVGGFMSGAHYPLRAAFFVLRHPSLWPYCIVPLLLNIVVLVGLVYWMWGDRETWLQTHLTETTWYWRAVRAVMQWLSVLLMVIAGLVAFVIVGSLAALPFNDLL